MKVQQISERTDIKDPVVTIGIFDGVHLGHQFILRALKQRAEEIGGSSVVVSLWPHPRLVLNKDVWNFRLLHSREEKILKLSELGIDYLLMIPFTPEVASLSACEFVSEYLVKTFRMKELMIGYDNRFGKDRQGDPEGLAHCAGMNGFRIIKLPELKGDGVKVNSTHIRERLLEGDLSGAREMLGYDYLLTGSVVDGNRIGRTIGFPTANIHPLDPYKLIPPDGVYAVHVDHNSERYTGMLNIGYRPTIDSASPVKTIEVHLLDFDGDLYGEQVVVHFRSRIRNEMKFTGVAELKAQLERDRETVKRMEFK